jgi:hypothetical protein
MPQDNKNSPDGRPDAVADFETVRNASEGFRNLPKASEHFGSVPKDSEGFRTFPKHSERKADHTATVREAARMFETAGVARTERSITNWCQPTKAGIARLDAYFDPNERKYYITPESLDRAIEEEKAKAVRGDRAPEKTEDVPKGSESQSQASERTPEAENTTDRVKGLEKEVLDLKILNSGKDLLIDALRKDRDGMINQVVEFSRKVGQLETELRQLSAPQNDSQDQNHNHVIP